MKAVISNAKHPEYGQATISLPIPAEQYDNVIGLLDALKIGDTVEQDCHVDELAGHYPILKRLEGSSVNIDELDYLAKRLESFCEGENAKFQGMAVKLGICDITDFINLTFCCQEATVITDFSSLEKIGKTHLMTVHGGCVTSAELDQADGRRIALDLICNHEGYVTPYGVVYDNGMKLDQLYDGRHFPGYYYEPPVLAFEAISDEDGFTGLLSLPMPERQLTRLMQRAETQRPDVHFMVSVNALPEKVSDALDLERLASEDLVGLNRLCKAVEFFNDYGKEKLNAAVLLTETSGIESLCRLAENIDMFDFIPDVHAIERQNGFERHRPDGAPPWTEQRRFWTDAVLHTLDDYDVCLHAGTYEQLGRFYLDRIAKAPDIVRGYIDIEQAGRLYENLQPGMFKGSCYVEFHEGRTEPIREGNKPLLPDTDWSVKLKLASTSVPEGVWLRLPDYSEIIGAYASETELVLDALNVQQLEECTLLEVRCILPEAGNLMEQYDSVSELIRDNNDLGFVLDEHGQGEKNFMEKFASALEYEDCRTLRFALDISQNLHCYEYIPCKDLEGLAKEHLEVEGVSEELLSSGCIDLGRFAEDLLENAGYTLNSSESGYIARNNREFVREYTTPEQGGMTMQQMV